MRRRMREIREGTDDEIPGRKKVEIFEGSAWIYRLVGKGRACSLVERACEICDASKRVRSAAFELEM